MSDFRKRLLVRMSYLSIALGIAISVLGDRACEADDATVARFRDEYPDAGKRVESVYSHIALSSRCSYYDDDKFRSEMKFEFVRDGSRFRFVKEPLTPQNHPFGAREGFIMNDSWFFMSGRLDPATPMTLGTAKPASDRAFELCFELMEPPLLNLYGFHFGTGWSHSFLDMFDWKSLGQNSTEMSVLPAKLVDANVVQLQHENGTAREMVTLYCRMNSGHSAEFTLSPADQWIVVDYKIEKPDTIYLTGRHEFEGSHNGVPLIRSCEYHFKVKRADSEEFRVSSLKADVLFINASRELPAALFEPEEIGVKFTPPIAQTTAGPEPVKWPWLLLVGCVVLLIVAVCLRYLARRNWA